MAGQMIINGEVVSPVLLEGYPEPTGSIDITENGTYDVKDYAEANVNIQGGIDYPTELVFRLPDSVTEITERRKYYEYFSNFPEKITDISVDLNKLSSVSGQECFSYLTGYISNIKKIIIPTLTIEEGATEAFYDAFYYSEIEDIYIGEIVCKANSGFCRAFEGSNIKGTLDINIKELGYRGGLLTFAYCRFEQPTFTFKKLDKVGVGGLAVCFEGSSGLTDIYFPALNSNSFPDGEAGQFEEMLLACENITVHFPSNLESVIGNWSDVVGGFAGTNTTVLFDLDATE